MLVPRSHPQIPSQVTHPAFLRESGTWGVAATESINYPIPFWSCCLMKSQLKQKGIPLFPPSSDEELLSHWKEKLGSQAASFKCSLCCVTGLKRACIQTSPWFWASREEWHERSPWNLHRCLTDRGVISGKGVMHVTRALLWGVHYLTPPLQWLGQEGGWRSSLHFLDSRMIKTPCGA